MTGKPSITLNNSRMSSRWNSNNMSKYLRRSSLVSDKIIPRILSMRSAAKNICSVRHRPIPSAPSSLALAASSGVSAFALTLSLRCLSAQDKSIWKSSLELASVLGISPSMTSPAVPSRVIMSPRLITTPSAVTAVPCW